jgi:NapC/NirT cytochrome c family, N-terminal region
VNLVIGSQLTLSAVSYMDSEEFCGKTCHTVMTPEFTAYKASAHSHVSCTNCHIGNGAPWFVKAKISGTRQLFAVLLHTYQRPISSPVYALRPARDVCEKCHWPQRFAGDMFMVKKHYADDEKNTAATSVLLMRVGGQNWKGTVGIHGAHSDLKGHMDYVTTDGRRQVIPEVTYISPDGKRTTYRSSEIKVTPQQLEAGEHRTMDCVDCHNRPSHVFEQPESAVDKVMAQGRISPSLPYIKKQVVAALRVDYPDRETAAKQIEATLRDYYQKNYPGTDQTALTNAVEGAKAIYAQNIFPDMKVTWGVHPNNIGHMEFPGCFRCHDGNHVAEGGKTIPNDCSTCHDLLAMEEKDPKILKDMGVNPGADSSGGTNK